LHNHPTGISPVVLFLHFSAEGDPPALAKVLQSAIKSTATPLPHRHSGPERTNVDESTISRIAGGTANPREGGVLQITRPRTEHIVLGNVQVPPAFGIEFTFEFQSDDRPNGTTATLEMPLLAGEVSRVARALRRDGFDVTAAQNHHLFDLPRLFFVHSTGSGSAESVAATLSHALGRTSAGSRRSELVGVAAEALVVSFAE